MTNTIILRSVMRDQENNTILSSLDSQLRRNLLVLSYDIYSVARS